MNSPLQKSSFFEKGSSNLYGKKVWNSIKNMCFNMARQRLVPYSMLLGVY